MTDSIQQEEVQLWSGHPSQLTGLGFYVLCALIFAVVVATASFLTYDSQVKSAMYLSLVALPIIIIVALIKYFAIRSTVYELSSQRLRIEEGVFSRRSEEVELYRIHDWHLEQPFWLRALGRGHVVFLSSDSTAPRVTLKAIIRPRNVMELARTHIEKIRDTKRVVQTIDFDASGGLQP